MCVGYSVRLVWCDWCDWCAMGVGYSVRLVRLGWCDWCDMGAGAPDGRGHAVLGVEEDRGVARLRETLEQRPASHIIQSVSQSVSQLVSQSVTLYSQSVSQSVSRLHYTQQRKIY